MSSDNCLAKPLANPPSSGAGRPGSSNPFPLFGMSPTQKPPTDFPSHTISSTLWTACDDSGAAVLNIPPYEYEPLDITTEEQRFLILQPCAGDKDAADNHVRCTLEVRRLANACPFIAVRNTRGYRLLNDAIEIDGKSLIVSAALEVFLRHFRRHDVPVTLWIRHVCLQEFTSGEERSQYWTRDFVDSMYERATEVVDMAEFVADLVQQNTVMRRVATQYMQWLKFWDGCMPKDFTYTIPRIIPIRLGSKPNDSMPTNTYNYVPLDMLANEIRLLVIEPSADIDEPLVMRLAHCPILCEVTYEALSYTWGVEPPTTEVIVSGQKLLIRKNLDMALRTIRQPAHHVAIWADAVCIDQSNMRERSRQVERMFDIYHRAIQVLCYVGETDRDSETGLDFITELNHMCWPPTDESGKRTVTIDMEKIPGPCSALYKFLCRPYFRRAWILQEVAISSGPKILIGNRKVVDSSPAYNAVDLRTLDSAAFNLQGLMAVISLLGPAMMTADPSLKAPGVSHHELSFIRKLFYFRHLVSRGAGHHYASMPKPDIDEHSPGFLETAILARDFQATDPRDKIFALWNFAREKDGMKGFYLDYSLSVKTVFQDFATAWARQHGSLDVIAASQPFNDPNSFYEAAPSWCPDWSTPSITSCLVRRETIPMRPMADMGDLDGVLYSADGGVAQLQGATTFFRFDGDILECRGVILDQIEAVGRDPVTDHECNCHSPCRDDFANFQRWCATLQSTYRERQDSPYEDPLQAAVAMFHGDVPSAWMRQETMLNIADAYRFGSTSGNEEHDLWRFYRCDPERSRHVPTHPSQYELYPYFDIVRTMIRGKTVCVTEKGYMGLMPSHVQDKPHERWLLAVLATCSVPVLLQEVEDPAGLPTYKFYGTCFIQGWMEGEMLQPPPSGESPAEFWFTNEMEGARLRIR